MKSTQLIANEKPTIFWMDIQTYSKTPADATNRFIMPDHVQQIKLLETSVFSRKYCIFEASYRFIFFRFIFRERFAIELKR